jgi:hypothetical protein
LLNGKSYIKIIIFPHIYQFFNKKVIKVLIHYVISSSWVCKCKGKLLGHQLQARDVINKPNLDVSLHFDLGYMDFSRLHTSPNYLN